MRYLINDPQSPFHSRELQAYEDAELLQFHDMLAEKEHAERMFADANVELLQVANDVQDAAARNDNAELSEWPHNAVSPVPPALIFGR